MLEEILCKFRYTVYVDKENGFCINNYVTLEDMRFVAKGNCLEPYSSSKMIVKLTGKWQKDRTGKTAFCVSSFEKTSGNTKAGFIAYVKSNYEGIGEKSALKILEQIGFDDQKLNELFSDEYHLGKIIGKGRAKKIVQRNCEQKMTKDMFTLLYDAGINEKIIRKFLRDYSEKGYNIIYENPFVLSEYGVAFRQLNSLCLQLTEINEDILFSPERIKTAILYVLRLVISSQGHTYANSSYVKSYALDLLNQNVTKKIITEKMVVDQLNIMRKVDKTIKCEIINNEIIVFDAFYHNAETYITERVHKLIQNKPKQFKNNQIDSAICSFEKIYNLTLSEDQKLAVRNTVNNNFLVITGGPGTGKTTVLKFCIAVYSHLCRETVVLTAPTGRASRRMSEATDMFEASTLHSLLGITGDTMFNVEKTPNTIEASLVFLDETSMCDIGMVYKLFYNSNEKTRFVFIGDPDQLPPVGAGNVLDDLIKSLQVPTVSLNVIHRQAQKSKIVSNARLIKEGKTPLETANDFCFYRSNNDKQIQDTVVFLFKEEYEKINNLYEVQVIAPKREIGLLSALKLNREIQKAVNPIVYDEHNKIIEAYVKINDDIIFKQNDKVICQKNTPTVKNGDIGIVTKVIQEKGKNNILEITFEGQEPELFSRSTCIELKIVLAYAITVHKSQGSEFQSVILPISEENQIMLKRKLLYTAVTRAKSKMIIVGDAKEITKAIENNSEKTRNSRLCFRLKNYASV